jgi:hypothetical protein
MIQTALKPRINIFWAPFFARGRAKKPGFPLQVLGFAHANPVGFPLQSLAPRSAGPRICQRKFAVSQDARAGRKMAYAILRPAPIARPEACRILNRLLAFSGFAVKKIYESSSAALRRAWLIFPRRAFL